MDLHREAPRATERLMVARMTYDETGSVRTSVREFATKQPNDDLPTLTIGDVVAPIVLLCNDEMRSVQ